MVNSKKYMYTQIQAKVNSLAVSALVISNHMIRALWLALGLGKKFLDYNHNQAWV